MFPKLSATVFISRTPSRATYPSTPKECLTDTSIKLLTGLFAIAYNASTVPTVKKFPAINTEGLIIVLISSATDSILFAWNEAGWVQADESWRVGLVCV